MEQKSINKMVKALLKQYNYSDINANIEEILKTEQPFWADCVKAALAVIQEDYVLVKKEAVEEINAQLQQAQKMRAALERIYNAITYGNTTYDAIREVTIQALNNKE